MPYYKNANHISYFAYRHRSVSDGVYISEPFQLSVISISYKGRLSIPSKSNYIGQIGLHLRDSLASSSQGLGGVPPHPAHSSLFKFNSCCRVKEGTGKRTREKKTHKGVKNETSYSDRDFHYIWNEQYELIMKIKQWKRQDLGASIVYLTILIKIIKEAHTT